MIAAAAELGLRTGWLDLASRIGPPRELAEPLGAGAWRAVSRTESGIAAATRVDGPLVLRDLLRRHFAGCRLVLVRGEIEAPRLEPRGERWLVESSGGRIELATRDLAARLRRPAATFLAP